jgi:hypothetical protein
MNTSPDWTSSLTKSLSPDRSKTGVPALSKSDHENLIQIICGAKSPLCNHKDPCAIHQLKRTGKTVLICWGLRILLKLWSSKKILLKNPFQAIRIILKFATTKDAFNLALIMGSLSLIKGAVCLQKKYWSEKLGLNSIIGVDTSAAESKINYFLPGFGFGLLSFFFVHHDYRNLVALYTFSRCLDLLWCSYKKKKGYETRSIEYGFLYMLMTTTIILAFCFDPDLMPESLYKLYVKFSSLTEEELIQKNILTWKFGIHHYD